MLLVFLMFIFCLGACVYWYYKSKFKLLKIAKSENTIEILVACAIGIIATVLATLLVGIPLAIVVYLYLRFCRKLSKEE